MYFTRIINIMQERMKLENRKTTHIIKHSSEDYADQGSSANSRLYRLQTTTQEIHVCKQRKKLTMRENRTDE